MMQRVDTEIAFEASGQLHDDTDAMSPDTTLWFTHPMTRLGDLDPFNDMTSGFVAGPGPYRAEWRLHDGSPIPWTETHVEDFSASLQTIPIYELNELSRQSGQHEDTLVLWPTSVAEIVYDPRHWGAEANELIGQCARLFSEPIIQELREAVGAYIAKNVAQRQDASPVLNSLASTFEVAPSTVMRWARGKSQPHPRLAMQIIRHIRRLQECSSSSSQ